VAIDAPPIQAPQQNNDRLQDNNDTSNKDNKPKTTSQRGLPTDKESLQSKDISIKIGRVLLLVAGFFHYFHLIQVCGY
jgi:hypothetical protein